MKYIVLAAIASSLFAADAPKPLSPEFAKAGLKALITVKNGVRPEMSAVELARVQTAMDDAEIAAATENDKAGFDLIVKYHARRAMDAASFETRWTFREADLTATRGDHARDEAFREELLSPATKKEAETANACSDQIEKIMRSGVLIPVPQCDVSLPRLTTDPLCDPALIARKKKLLPGYTAPAQCQVP